MRIITTLYNLRKSIKLLLYFRIDYTILLLWWYIMSTPLTLMTPCCVAKCRFTFTHRLKIQLEVAIRLLIKWAFLPILRTSYKYIYKYLFGSYSRKIMEGQKQHVSVSTLNKTVVIVAVFGHFCAHNKLNGLSGL